MGLPFFSLPIELYENLESVLQEIGIVTTDISLSEEYGQRSEQYVEEAKQGKRKCFLMHFNGSQVFISCNTIDFSESYEATLQIFQSGKNGYGEILKLIEPILSKHGGKKL